MWFGCRLKWLEIVLRIKSGGRRSFGSGLNSALRIKSGGLKPVLRIESGGLEVVLRWLELSVANGIWWFGGRSEML